ncbi:hypothetical protein [Vibrio cholerae]|uniref:hypothetical protein n=1 Tax=Vibrio cholerae TaxID=666 RepID=UPI002FDBF30A|nr:hypothetical protein [Vibrio cholerae]EGR1312018.1 hypothetical protein [Vibrio cholerae]
MTLPSLNTSLLHNSYLTQSDETDKKRTELRLPPIVVSKNDLSHKPLRNTHPDERTYLPNIENKSTSQGKLSSSNKSDFFSKPLLRETGFKKAMYVDLKHPNPTRYEATARNIDYPTINSLNTRGYEFECYLSDKIPGRYHHITLFKSCDEFAGVPFEVELDGSSILEFKTPPMINQQARGHDLCNWFKPYRKDLAQVMRDVGKAYNTKFIVDPSFIEKFEDAVLNDPAYKRFNKDYALHNELKMKGKELPLRLATVEERAKDQHKANEELLKTISFIKKNHDKPDAVAKYLVTGVTGPTSKSIQTNFGTSYGKLVEFVKTNHQELSPEPENQRYLNTLANVCANQKFNSPFLNNNKDTIQGYLLHTLLCLHEVNSLSPELKMKKNVGLKLHPKTSPEDGFGALPAMPDSAFKELCNVIKSRDFGHSSNTNKLIQNLTSIHTARKEFSGQPLIFERKRSEEPELISHLEKFHTMNRPDTRVRVPMTDNNVGVVFEARDYQAAINRAI